MSGMNQDNNQELMDIMEHLDDPSLNVEELCNVNFEDEDMPTALIIANIPQIIFDDEASRGQFEEVFRLLDPAVTFIYLKNFRRARLQFSSSTTAGIARLKYDGLPIGDARIKCYFSQVQQQASNENSFLRPPEPKRLFLLSPPASPPVGWEPMPESEPVIDYDLLNALARLSPGETHELHPKSLNAPSIVVHLCEDPEDLPNAPKPTIVQTRRPEPNMS